jgi:tryptophanyl-tRNA synthetase
MIQFKEKSAKAGRQAEAAGDEERKASGDGASTSTSTSSSNEESVGAGLLTYPVLMAADILAYRAELVPVGEDQKQHIELARDIAERFNSRYGGRNWKKMGGRGGRLFVPPEPMTPRNGARVMSLSDGTAKMSKSAENDASRINLLDSSEVIANKIKRAKTDAVAGFADCVDGSGLASRPEARNLLTIYALVSGLASPEEAAKQVAECSWGEFKPRLAEAVVEHLRPLQSKYKEVIGDSGELEKIMAKGAEDASAVADATLADVRQAMGFVPRPPRK